ncbi:unnamed protein product [Cochlearia groenlandica]
MKNPPGTSLALFWLGAFATIHLVKSQTQEGFISLDCGLPLSESPHIEPENEIQYSSDENFIQSGKIGIIPKNLASKNLKPYSTLRYFPDGIRNCYDVKVEKGGTYLIRAMFLYGNLISTWSYGELIGSKGELRRSSLEAKEKKWSFSGLETASPSRRGEGAEASSR